MFHTTDNPHIFLTINGVAIAQDSAGRYRITDLHKAAGGEDQHKPLNWLRNRKTQELAESIRKKHFSNMRSEVVESYEPVKTINGGDYPGTYVHEDLVIDYAMWISADFKLRVIQAFREQQLKLRDSPDSFFSTHLREERALLQEQIALLKTLIKLQHHYLTRCGEAVEADVETHPVLPPISYSRA